MNSPNQDSILLTTIIEQNNAMIALIGKMAFTKDEVLNIVVTGKQKLKQQKYIEGYNSCDGNHSVSQVAAIIGVTDSTLSPILRSWEEYGIIYPLSSSRLGKFYKKIFPI